MIVDDGYEVSEFHLFIIVLYKRLRIFGLMVCNNKKMMVIIMDLV